MTNQKRGGPADDERFESIYRQYYARVWRFYRRNSVADDEAHDLAQDTFKRLYEHLSDIRSADPWPFVKKVAHNVLLNRVRARMTHMRNARTVDIDDPDTHHELPRTPEPDYAEREQAARRQERLYREIDGLTEAQKQVLLLQLQEDKSYEEIAADLRITMNAVKSRRRDALRELKSRMRAEPGGVQWPGGDSEEEQ
jgi:RNA polymerase sigma-70 factor (ECF subfamily)